MSTHQLLEPGTRHRRLLFLAAILASAILIVFPLMAWTAYSQHGVVGIWATSVAALVCFLAGLGALVCSALLRGEMAVQGVLAGMIFRMGPPLATAVVLNASGGSLASGGIFGQILGFYFVVLIVETVLSLQFVEHGKRGSTDSTARSSS